MAKPTDSVLFFPMGELQRPKYWTQKEKNKEEEKRWPTSIYLLLLLCCCCCLNGGSKTLIREVAAGSKQIRSGSCERDKDKNRRRPIENNSFCLHSCYRLPIEEGDRTLPRFPYRKLASIFLGLATMSSSDFCHGPWDPILTPSIPSYQNY